jgi:hypothetical protein
VVEVGVWWEWRHNPLCGLGLYRDRVMRSEEWRFPDEAVAIDVEAADGLEERNRRVTLRKAGGQTASGTALLKEKLWDVDAVYLVV